MIETWGYPWDGSDTEGSITELLSTDAECVMATDCARRVVAQGHNVKALRAIARDTENMYADIVAGARQALANLSKLAQEQAHTADLVAREAGYGAIGDHRGRSSE